MKINYVAKNYVISTKFKDIIEKKLNKLDKYLNNNATVKVACYEQGNNDKLEITLNADGMFFRSEVLSDNMYNNIDLALPKLEKQIVKLGAKYKNKFKNVDFTRDFLFFDEAPEMPIDKVVKTKTFELEPLTIDDAEAQMEAVGHNFYIFLNAETGKVNVLYRRNDGNLGLIEVRY